MDFRFIRRIIWLVILPIAVNFISLQGCEDIKAPAQEMIAENPTDSGNDNPPENPGSDDTIQPVESYIGVKDESFFVQQDDSQCGPTSFYMIFRYYGDPYSGATLSTTAECLTDTILTEITEAFTIILDTSWVSNWLDSFSDGIDCRNFFEKISALSQCAGGTSLPFYSTVDGNCKLTADEPENYDAEANVERRNRFGYILENFLKKQYPVILHLRRMYDDYPYIWYPGHYVVLMGYDTETHEVYIMDPFQPYETHSVMAVPYDTFIMTRWYKASGSLAYLYPDARWDGTWIGFHH